MIARLSLTLSMLLASLSGWLLVDGYSGAGTLCLILAWFAGLVAVDRWLGEPR